MKQIKLGTLMGLQLVVAGIFCSIPVSASASGTLVNIINSAGLCKGASGFGAQYFYFAPRYIENTSADQQYLICSFGHIRDTTLFYPTGGSSGYQIDIGFANPTAADSNITCGAAMGYSGASSSSLINVVSQITVLAGRPLYYASFSMTQLPVNSTGQPVDVSCGLPPGLRMTLVEMFQPKNF